MLRDLRYAAQGLWRSPGFTAAVTLSLGLAIGANATIFGAVDALWLRPPGARAPGELVRIFSTTEATRDGLWSFAEFRDLREGTRAFSGVAARGRRGTLLRLPDGTTELQLVNVVSLDFFSTLGVVLREGARLAIIGVIAGVPVAVLAAGAMTSLLFGVGPIDVPSFAAAVGIVLAIVILATLVPARRALAVMPSVALRNE